MERARSAAEFLLDKRAARFDRNGSGLDIIFEDGERLSVDGIFIAVGTRPITEAFKGQVEMDAAGYIAAGEDCRTSVPGIFCAGDCRTKPLRQVVTAASDGAVAANAASIWLDEQPTK